MTLTYIRPDADDTDGNWTNESDSQTNLFASIDETVASDTDYIKSVHLPDHDICKIRLSDPSFMVMRPATVHYRFKKRGETTQQINLDVSLLQGATEIAKWTETDISTSYVDGSQTLTLAQFNSISDFNNLYIQFDASSSWWLAASEVDLWFEDNLYHLSTALSSASLLLHCDGADAATGVGAFIDATGRHQVSVAGNAQVDTAQSKFGGASALLDGTGDYLSLESSSDFAFGTGDFTIDCWIRLNATSTSQAIINFGTYTGTFAPHLYIFTDNKLYYVLNGVDRISGTTTLTTATWYHIALTRSGTSTKLFVNGTQEGSTYTAGDTLVLDSGDFPHIGAQHTAAQNFNGWIDEVRVLKGTAAWTTTFTPPTAPYNVALSGPYAHLSCSRASVGYATTSSGTLTQFAANALRITDLGLLVEDARENKALQSQDFATTWGAFRGTITANSIAAPDGTTTADTVVESASGSERVIIYQAVSGIVDTTNYAISVYAKAATRNYCYVCFTGAGNEYYFSVVFDLLNGVVGETKLGSSSGTVVSTSIEALANGWYRCSAAGSINEPTETTGAIRCGPAGAASGNTFGAQGDPFYTSTTSTNAIYIWGYQWETGSFPSSYIATTTGTQTRAADAVSLIGNLNNVVKAYVGSAVFDLLHEASGSAIPLGLFIGDNSTGDSIVAVNASSTTFGATGFTNGTLGGGTTWPTGAKAGQAWSTGVTGSIVGGGGTVVNSATPWNNTSHTTLYLGSNGGGNSVFGYFRRLTAWTSKLADATLQTMTDPAHTINFTTDEAAIDLDFANAAYNAITLPTDFLIISRASVGYAQTVAGTLQLFGNNQLRITDKGLLVEDARTNYITRSQDFTDSGVWNSPTNITITGDTTTAPDGTTTADSLVPTATNATHGIGGPTAGTMATGQATASCYLKANGYGFASVKLFYGGGTAEWSAIINLSTGAIGATSNGGTSPTNTNQVAETLGNGWFRLSVTMDIVGTSAAMQVNVHSTNSFSGFAGNTTSGIYAWGAQIENIASFPSSYIPTTSGSQTRAADFVQVVGHADAVLSAVPNSFVTSAISPYRATNSDRWLVSGANNNVAIGLRNNNVTYFHSRADSSNSGEPNLGSGLFSTGFKIGFADDGVNMSGVGNAGTVLNAATIQSPYFAKANVMSSGGSSGSSGYLRRFTMWTTKLADATLQGFTNP